MKLTGTAVLLYAALFVTSVFAGLEDAFSSYAKLARSFTPTRNEPVAIPLYKRSPRFHQLSVDQRLTQLIEKHRRTKGKYGVEEPNTTGARAAGRSDHQIERRGGATNAAERIARLTEKLRRTKDKFGFEGLEERNSVDLGIEKRAIQGLTGSETLAGNDLSYYTSIALGTPPVTYEVVVDTGSADLVLATSASNTCGSLCVTTAPLYSPAKSSSSIISTQTVRITYGTGSASGVIVEDTMSMAGFKAQQLIAACSSVSSLTTSSDQSGLIGLGWSGLSSSKSTPFVEGLWRSGQLTNPVFGFGFAELDVTDVDPMAVVPGGVMTIGGVNETLFIGSLNYVDIVSQTYWGVPLDNVGVQGNLLGISAANAIIDTGTNGITIPTSAAAAVYAQIPESSIIPNSGGLYQYPCSTSVTFSLTIGGIVYPMQPKNFNLGASTSDGKNCVGAVAAMAGSSSSANPTWIIGTPFLMSFYTAYRFFPPSIGFAPTADPRNVLETLAIPTSGSTFVGAVNGGAAPQSSGLGTTTVANNPKSGSSSSTSGAKTGMQASATAQPVASSGADRLARGGAGLGAFLLGMGLSIS